MSARFEANLSGSPMPSGGCQGDCMLPSGRHITRGPLALCTQELFGGRHNLDLSLPVPLAGAHAEPLHLLLTDVVMPGLVTASMPPARRSGSRSGRCSEARRSRPSGLTTPLRAAPALSVRLLGYVGSAADGRLCPRYHPSHGSGLARLGQGGAREVVHPSQRAVLGRASHWPAMWPVEQPIQDATECEVAGPDGPVFTHLACHTAWAQESQVRRERPDRDGACGWWLCSAGCND